MQIIVPHKFKIYTNTGMSSYHLFFVKKKFPMRLEMYIIDHL